MFHGSHAKSLPTSDPLRLIQEQLCIIGRITTLLASKIVNIVLFHHGPKDFFL